MKQDNNKTIAAGLYNRQSRFITIGSTEGGLKNQHVQQFCIRQFLILIMKLGNKSTVSPLHKCQDCRLRNIYYSINYQMRKHDNSFRKSWCKTFKMAVVLLVQLKNKEQVTSTYLVHRLKGPRPQMILITFPKLTTSTRHTNTYLCN